MGEGITWGGGPGGGSGGSVEEIEEVGYDNGTGLMLAGDQSLKELKLLNR